MPELQRLHQSNVVLLLAAINDVQPLQASRTFADDYFSRPVNEMIKPLHCDPQDIVLGIVRNADQGEASRLHPIAEALDFDQSPLACSTIRDKLLAHLKSQNWAHTDLLNVTVNGGVVDLWGIVTSASERNAIRAAAETTPGVRAVNDSLRLLPSPAYA